MLLGVLVALFVLSVGVALVRRQLDRQRRDAAALAQRSRVLYELAEGDQHHVAAELERVCEGSPSDPSVFLALAAIDRGRGRIERAKAIHRTVLASAELAHEQRVVALVGLGRDLLAEGNVAAAVGALNRATSLAPSSLATLESLAEALDRAGAWERAAAVWERVEKQAGGRRARGAKVGRGRALAGQAIEAHGSGETEKAGKLVQRAHELAPGSGYVSTVVARIKAARGGGRPHDVLLSWQRAWELSSGGAAPVVAEAVAWADAHGHADALLERMRASLRATQDPDLVVTLALAAAKHDAVLARSALQRVAGRSLAARWELLCMALAADDRETAEFAVAAGPSAPRLTCRVCGVRLQRFAFRCPSCSSWESVIGDAGGFADGPRSH
ncbi:MAG: hypothetical protein V3V08_26270 [Nannocystaceae bacterium]